ncbi:hypothetical protein [Algoriphagus litoralis]|uniref:hypothetical protein n=1 Tax=Algoriphagus litoralis TaxID=2202829 RepID=UPI000DBA44DA|nr:hypothetical protein [Algoriphagus litoralis]
MFDIDIPTLVVTSVLMAAVFAIFFYYSLKIRRTRKELSAKYNHFISERNLKPTLREDWRNRFILGIDQPNKTLVYCNFGEKEEKLAISLPEVSRVEVLEDFQEGTNGTKSFKTLENLALKIQFKNPSKAALQLPIYSAEDYSDLLGETVLASNWSKLINSELTK